MRKSCACLARFLAKEISRLVCPGGSSIPEIYHQWSPGEMFKEVVAAVQVSLAGYGQRREQQFIPCCRVRWISSSSSTSPLEREGIRRRSSDNGIKLGMIRNLAEVGCSSIRCSRRGCRPEVEGLLDIIGSGEWTEESSSHVSAKWRMYGRERSCLFLHYIGKVQSQGVCPASDGGHALE